MEAPWGSALQSSSPQTPPALQIFSSLLDSQALPGPHTPMAMEGGSVGGHLTTCICGVSMLPLSAGDSWEGALPQI